MEVELLALERRLARLDRIDELLSGDFVEIGSSGLVYDKARVLAAVAASPPRELQVEDFDARLLAPDVALATCSAGGSLRSSIWVRQGGRWSIVFHQATPSPPR